MGLSLSVNTIRTLSMDTVQQANSGHPGTPMAMAAYVLWQEYLRFDPRLKGIVADIPPAYYDIRLPQTS